VKDPVVSRIEQRIAAWTFLTGGEGWNIQFSEIFEFDV
jgi:hypothetical protein